ncbi:hypothetical protein AB434_0424 [Heyndrickxia coagulans]|uniref:Uncharacterized protein n=2 Tax=Heyndrickxia coagulans TaxID=1398 RepID=A0A133L2P5_HEYCO|nr:hypothetical protein AB434_0424 [Heyndrickxia coagulans]KWZ86221.1 hypothetical protein HMPREF3213_00132 [Heyndrickxia coagulans]
MFNSLFGMAIDLLFSPYHSHGKAILTIFLQCTQKCRKEQKPLRHFYVPFNKR